MKITMRVLVASVALTSTGEHFMSSLVYEIEFDLHKTAHLMLPLLLLVCQLWARPLAIITIPPISVALVVSRPI